MKAVPFIFVLLSAWAARLVEHLPFAFWTAYGHCTLSHRSLHLFLRQLDPYNTLSLFILLRVFLLCHSLPHLHIFHVILRLASVQLAESNGNVSSRSHRNTQLVLRYYQRTSNPQDIDSLLGYGSTGVIGLLKIQRGLRATRRWIPEVTLQLN